ncbi:MAG: murein biosynthesis integral membrane protein MurJ [Bacillota bacterium]|nr:murein biosynthesis integral membrane protein MurJ [Bacillota bacterium]
MIIKKTIILIMVITLLSRILGFVRELILAYMWGTSNIVDAYLVSLTIPGVIFGFVAAGITAAFIPTYNKILSNHDRDMTSRFTSNLTNIILLVTTVVLVLGLAFTEELVIASASGFSQNTLKIGVEFTRILLFSMYFSAILSIFSAYLHANNNFLAPAFITIILNLINIAFIYISYIYGYIYLAVGYLLSIIFQVVYIIPHLKRSGYKHKLVVDFKDKYLGKCIGMALPVIIGVSVNKINVLVDRTIASRITVGGIASLNYAFRISDLIQGLFVLSIITVIYPKISLLAQENRYMEFKKIFTGAVNSILFFTLPASIGLIIFSNKIIELLYGRGAFDNNSILLTSGALRFYSVGLIGMALREVVSRGFYALDDSITPVKNAVIAVCLNIILNIVLSKYLGINGVALATSIAATFTTILLFISLRKKIGPFGMKQISVSFLKILFASLVMGGLAKLSFNYLTSSLSQNISLLLAIGVGAVSYFIIIYFMKIEDVDVIVGAIKKKFGRGAA